MAGCHCQRPDPGTGSPINFTLSVSHPGSQARAAFDGYTITREVHAGSRSHVSLAVDDETGTPIIVKTPSIDLQDDAAYLEPFLTEEWIARRINSPYVVKSSLQIRKTSLSLYRDTNGVIAVPSARLL